MDGQRHSSSRRRKSKRSRTENKPNGNGKGQTREEPILIAARRPNAPAAHPKRRFIAASAAPLRSNPSRSERPNDAQAGREHARGGPENGAAAGADPTSGATHSNSTGADEVARHRAARVVQVQAAGPDDREKQRLKLIDRLLRSEGRGAITRAARELEAAGFEFPVEQNVQLQLLEHFDEGYAHRAVCHLTQLLNEEVPIKRPLFEQRLRRLEEFADDSELRQAASDLRRTVRA
jgi:hypothetical protein